MNTHQSNPESCALVRKDAREALTVADAGEPSSREIKHFGLPTLLSEAEGNTPPSATVSEAASPRGRRPSACIETSYMGTGISPKPAKGASPTRRAAKAKGRTAAMHASGKSDESVVSKKPANEVLPLWEWAEEQVEKRDSAKRNPEQDGTSRTQSRNHDVSPVLSRVREKAKQDRKTRFSALFHHLSLHRLQQAFERLEPKAAPGVDGEVWRTYNMQKDEQLENLHARLHRGAYRAKPSRRVFIPKPDGRQRPLGIAALEDKIVQGAVVGVLQAIYETDLLGFSHGFRPGRSPHRALDAWATALWTRKVSWVLDMDKHRASGQVSIVRYADDIVVGFENEEDARTFLEQVRERMGKFQLELHPEKTRLIRFGRFARDKCARQGRKPETFSFLGFTHICGRTRSGKYLLTRHTIAKRQRAKLKAVRDELMARRHEPMPAQGAWLRQVARGYYNYYAVPTNSRAMEQFRCELVKAWRFALRRRSQRSRVAWERMRILAQRWLPRGRVCHPWPWDRFAATTQGKSRVR